MNKGCRRSLHFILLMSFTNPKKILSLIENTGTNTASDIYLISPTIIELSGSFLTNYISDLFKVAFTIGTFPQLLKKAYFVQIYKSESR